MIFSTELSKVNVLAKTLLFETVCARTKFEDTGPQYLVFESADARRVQRHLELSSNSWIECSDVRLEVCDEEHDSEFRHSSDFCPLFRSQTEKVTDLE